MPHYFIMATNGILKNYSFNIKPLYPLYRIIVVSVTKRRGLLIISSGEIASGEELLFACIVGYNIEWIFPWKRNIIMPLKKSIAGCWLSRPRWMVDGGLHGNPKIHLTFGRQFSLNCRGITFFNRSMGITWESLPYLSYQLVL